MTDMDRLRAAVIGLVEFAGGHELALLNLAGSSEPAEGSPQCWAAEPLVAHIAEFKQQQVQRLSAVRQGLTPPTFAEIDHAAADVYRRYAEQAAVVAHVSRDTTRALIQGVIDAAAEDLLDPSRNPWLAGRMLWLQTVVRGFWHPTGHLSEYYLSHDLADRALELATHATTLADTLDAPGPARGMARYNLACVQARTGRLDAANDVLGQAIAANPDLTVNARRDPDLEPLRVNGALEVLLGAP
jgi:hypothetical protein